MTVTSFICPSFWGFMSSLPPPTKFLSRSIIALTMLKKAFIHRTMYCNIPWPGQVPQIQVDKANNSGRTSVNRVDVKLTLGR